jgi:uncharacterized damage-inducible protein DinB
MDALALIREQAATAERLLSQVVAELTAEQSIWHAEGSTANPIAAIFTHIYFSEDRLVQRRGQGRPPIYNAGGWRERLGVDPEAPWSGLTQVAPREMRAYAAEVRAATTRFLEGLPPADLEREVEGPRGRQTLAATMSLLLVIHKATHTGEIAALLGNQGVRGFPV